MQQADDGVDDISGFRQCGVIQTHIQACQDLILTFSVALVRLPKVSSVQVPTCDEMTRRNEQRVR